MDEKLEATFNIESGSSDDEETPTRPTQNQRINITGGDDTRDASKFDINKTKEDDTKSTSLLSRPDDSMISKLNSC